MNRIERRFSKLLARLKAGGWACVILIACSLFGVRRGGFRELETTPVAQMPID
jgi:hypothetical protein